MSFYFVVKHFELHFLYERCCTKFIIITITVTTLMDNWNSNYFVPPYHFIPKKYSSAYCVYFFQFNISIQHDHLAQKTMQVLPEVGRTTNIVKWMCLCGIRNIKRNIKKNICNLILDNSPSIWCQIKKSLFIQKGTGIQEIFQAASVIHIIVRELSHVLHKHIVRL